MPGVTARIWVFFIMGWLAQHQTCLCQMGSIFLTRARESLLTRYQDWLTGFKIDLKGERGNIRLWQTVKDSFQLNPFYDSMTQQHFLEQKMLLQTSQQFSCAGRSGFLLHHLVLQGWTLSPKYSLQTNDCILTLDAKMAPVFFQILQHSLNPSIWSCSNWMVWEQQVKMPVNVLGRAVYIL